MPTKMGSRDSTNYNKGNNHLRERLIFHTIIEVSVSTLYLRSMVSMVDNEICITSKSYISNSESVQLAHIFHFGQRMSDTSGIKIIKKGVN